MGAAGCSSRRYRRALFVETRVLGSERPEIAVLLNNLAVAQRRSGHPDAATASYRQALPLLERSLGPGNPTTTTCRNNLTAVTARA